MNDTQERAAMSRWRTVGLPTLGAVIAVGAWWGAKYLFQLPSLLLPSPKEVVDAFLRLPDHLLRQTWVTLAEVLIGFALSIVIGVLLGLVLSTSEVVKQMFYPLLVGLNAVPKLAFGPLFVIWLGFELKPKVVMVLVLCFFPIVLSTAYGLTSTPAELIEYARSLGTARWRVFLRVRFPYAMPQIFVGTKVAATLAVIGAVVGELLGSASGLGFVIQSAGSTSDTPLAFAAIVLTALLGGLVYFLVVLVERITVPWAREIAGRP